MTGGMSPAFCLWTLWYFAWVRSCAPACMQIPHTKFEVTFRALRCICGDIFLPQTNCAWSSCAALFICWALSQWEMACRQSRRFGMLWDPTLWELLTKAFFGSIPEKVNNKQPCEPYTFQLSVALAAIQNKHRLWFLSVCIELHISKSQTLHCYWMSWLYNRWVVQSHAFFDCIHCLNLFILADWLSLKASLKDIWF